MTDNPVTEAVKQTATSIRTFLSAQVDEQIVGFGQRLHATAGSVRALGEHAKSDPNVAVTAQLTEQAGAALERAASYLQGRKAEELLGDLEAYSRKQPLLATLAATAAGFTLSRALKASSTRRAQEDSGE